MNAVATAVTASRLSNKKVPKQSVLILAALRKRPANTDESVSDFCSAWWPCFSPTHVWKDNENAAVYANHRQASAISAHGHNLRSISNVPLSPGPIPLIRVAA